MTDTSLERWEQYDVGAVEFLIALVKGELPSEIIPSVVGLPGYRTLQGLAGAPGNQAAAGG